MVIGTVIGHATSTVKHESLAGWRLLVVQPLNAQFKPEADPILAIDATGAGSGTRVILSSDGKAARELVGNNKSPVRYFVCGIVD